MSHLEVKRTPDGKVLARRKDRRPLTSEDREEAARMAQKKASSRQPLQPQEGEIIQAVKIWSRVLEEEIWLILDRSFTPTDGMACYYAEEIPLLRDKTPEELREIHKVKLAFPGCRVIQEGAERINERVE